MVGNNIEKERSGWNFSGNVADTFYEHVSKSIVNYNEGHTLICELSSFFCSENSICYDLGASTGELLKKLSLFHSGKPKIRWIGIDNEIEMVKKAREIVKGILNIQLYSGDILDFEYEKSDFVISYYTIQFTHPKYRQQLIKRIYESLNKGGAFILFEKVVANNSRFQEIILSLYNEFKLKNDFTPEEIIHKSRSLCGVLKSFTTEENCIMLKEAGFNDYMVIMKNLCFEGYMAIK
jgi:Trans-aconitate methyltransferase